MNRRNQGSRIIKQIGEITKRNSLCCLEIKVQNYVFRFKLLELNFWIFVRKLGAIGWYQMNYQAPRSEWETRDGEPSTSVLLEEQKGWLLRRVPNRNWIR